MCKYTCAVWEIMVPFFDQTFNMSTGTPLKTQDIATSRRNAIRRGDVHREKSRAPVSDLCSLMQFHGGMALLSVGISWENGRQKRESKCQRPEYIHRENKLRRMRSRQKRAQPCILLRMQGLSITPAITLDAPRDAAVFPVYTPSLPDATRTPHVGRVHQLAYQVYQLTRAKNDERTSFESPVKHWQWEFKLQCGMLGLGTGKCPLTFHCIPAHPRPPLRSCVASVSWLWSPQCARGLI